jgi:hypothetical protein
MLLNCIHTFVHEIITFYFNFSVQNYLIRCFFKKTAPLCIAFLSRLKNRYEKHLLLHINERKKDAGGKFCPQCSEEMNINISQSVE